MHTFRARRHSPFNDVEDIEWLEALEQELLNELDHSPSYDLKEQRFYLNLRLWELQPDQDFYLNSIIRLVLDLGWDLKRRSINYEKAYQFFDDLIKMARPRSVPIAHYRLGFIEMYNKKYRNAIRHFEKALNPLMQRDRKPYSHECLTDSQRMRAQVQLAVALSRYSYETALLAKEGYNQLGQPEDADVDNIIRLEQEVLKLEAHPFTIFTPTGRKSISDQAYRALCTDETAFIFDATDHDCSRLIIHGRSCVLSPRRMSILEILFSSMKAVSQSDISDLLHMPQVSRYMRALKDDLIRHGLEEQVIQANQGYRIHHANPILIYNTNDPKYML